MRRSWGEKGEAVFRVAGNGIWAASLILFPPSKTCQLPTKSSNECKSLAPTFGGVLILKKAPNFIILWVIDRLHTHKNQLSKYCFSYLGIMRVIPSIERLIFIWQLRACSGIGFEPKARKFYFRQGKICSRMRAIRRKF